MSDSLRPHRALLSVGFSEQEYWSGLPFPPPGGLPDPGIEAAVPCVSCIAGGFFTAHPPGKPSDVPSACESWRDASGARVFTPEVRPAREVTSWQEGGGRDQGWQQAREPGTSTILPVAGDGAGSPALRSGLCRPPTVVPSSCFLLAAIPETACLVGSQGFQLFEPQGARPF